MVEQVNHIIYNLLASGRSVVLPTIGTFASVYHSARRTSKKELLPPYRKIEFSSKNEGHSLVDEIATVAGISTEQAQDIYDRWLLKTRVENTLTIEGVGTLKHKSFVTDEAFDKLLNPQGETPVRLHPARRGRAWIWVTVVILLLAGAYCGWRIVFEEIRIGIPFFNPTDNNLIINDVGVVDYEDEQATIEIETHVSDEKNTDTIAPAAQTEQTVQAEQQESNSAAVANATSRVVYGVFSTDANAKKAIAKVEKMGFTALQRPYGAMTMVYLLSGTREECETFRAANRLTFPDAWTYTKK